jgi:hypothetical protein
MQGERGRWVYAGAPVGTPSFCSGLTSTRRYGYSLPAGVKIRNRNHNRENLSLKTAGKPVTVRNPKCPWPCSKFSEPCSKCLRPCSKCSGPCSNVLGHVLNICYASYPILSSRASPMLLTYHICMTGPSLPSIGLTSDFAAI